MPQSEVRPSKARGQLARYAEAPQMPTTQPAPTSEADFRGAISMLTPLVATRNGNVRSSLELPEEEWEHTFNTRLKGAWLVSKYVCRHMRDAKQGGGSVINISSMAGLNRVIYAGTLAYSSSKMALDMVTKIMAIEMEVDNIRVNSIAPGYFKSEITEGLMQMKWFHSVTWRTVPLRTSRTIDQALTSVVRYLIHDSSDYISGNVFIVDAGNTLPGVPIFSSL
ncbi:uncharacterized protein LOC129894254 [Solanum dulcamara]|uniref:uncharacterized protein LOC129894254 n=1 Tax=Solanum dulcamara TaxID=45834 RepID=UPI0024855353|nr:uncharacterized protein LOC129894254 [Solanum dulcamara]